MRVIQRTTVEYYLGKLFLLYLAAKITYFSWKIVNVLRSDDAPLAEGQNVK